jgi:hypothetical protein
MGDVNLISSVEALCCSLSCQNKYQLFVSLFKSINRFTRICCKELSPLHIYLKKVLNNPKVFRFPHSHRSRRLRSGDCAGQLTGAPRELHSVAHFWFGMTCGEVELLLHHPYTVPAVFDEEDYHPRVLVNH